MQAHRRRRLCPLPSSRLRTASVCWHIPAASAAGCRRQWCFRWRTAAAPAACLPARSASCRGRPPSRWRSAAPAPSAWHWLRRRSQCCTSAPSPPPASAANSICRPPSRPQGSSGSCRTSAASPWSGCTRPPSAYQMQLRVRHSSAARCCHTRLWFSRSGQRPCCRCCAVRLPCPASGCSTPKRSVLSVLRRSSSSRRSA